MTLCLGQPPKTRYNLFQPLVPSATRSFKLLPTTTLFMIYKDPGDPL